MSDRIFITSETDLKRACWTALMGRGCYCWIQNQGGFAGEYKGRKRFVWMTRGMKGISDIIGWTPDGRFLAVECKMKGNKPTDEQRNFLEMVKKSGGVAILAYSVQDVFDGLDGRVRPGLVSMGL